MGVLLSSRGLGTYAVDDIANPYLWAGPYNGDHTILGSILGLTLFKVTTVFH